MTTMAAEMSRVTIKVASDVSRWDDSAQRYIVIIVSIISLPA